MEFHKDIHFHLRNKTIQSMSWLKNDPSEIATIYDMKSGNSVFLFVEAMKVFVALGSNIGTKFSSVSQS